MTIVQHSHYLHFTVMPKNCDEIFQKNKMSKDGVYTIDADGTGPIPEFQVTFPAKLFVLHNKDNLW